ncbi:MAG TPA: aspartyl protease family protein [Gemmataceae bacterium]|nr:aspartyl protease family protein [Gemmataceae bacterium]
MGFPYLPVALPGPVYSLGGQTTRHYPVLPATVSTQAGVVLRDGLLDSGAADTIFPVAVAQKLGIDLRNAPTGQARQAGGGPLTYHFAAVTLRISDGQETCEWPAIVGFVAAPMRWALLGQTGFLQFFDVTLFGARRAVELTPNATFPGRHTVH